MSLLLVVVLAAVSGLLIGSFLTVVVDRVPRGESVMTPPSHCDNCGLRLGARDLVPVVSWLALRGRCRACRVRISPRYPAVELVTGVVFALLVWSQGLGPTTPLWLVLAAGLLAAALIDFDGKQLRHDIGWRARSQT